MPDDLIKKNKVKLAGFAGRVATRQTTGDVVEQATVPNRIGLMPDNSGSMGDSGSKDKTKLELLKLAVDGFLAAVNFSDTQVAFYPIPVGTAPVNLTNQSALLSLGAMMLDASGGTPMAETMQTLLESEPITRAVLISDGQPTGVDPIPQAHVYKEAGVPIDCIHIGLGEAGEDTLQRIAEITGGIYLKFKDVQSFASGLKYLSPRYRALLNSPEAAKLTGATEVRR